jgi:hypothetical protein
MATLRCEATFQISWRLSREKKVSRSFLMVFGGGGHDVDSNKAQYLRLSCHAKRATINSCVSVAPEDQKL